MANGVLDMGGQVRQIGATDWCIVRTAGAGTLGVHDALVEAGYDAWTPVGTVIKRVGRERDRVEQRAALLPTFAFVRYDRLPDLLDLARSPGQVCQVWDSEARRMVAKGMPHFSVFRYGKGYPAVTDRELDRLRQIERRGKPVDQVRIFRPDEDVRYPSLGFEGLIGKVERVKGRYAFVSFSGFDVPVKVYAGSLLPAA